MTRRVIFVDDDRDVREALGQSLDLGGFDVTMCRAVVEAMDHIVCGLDGVVVTDMRMPGQDGFALLTRALKIDPDLPVIVLTGEGDIPMAVRAMNEGAYDFLEKPCPPKRLLEAVERACEKRALVLENRRLRAQRGAISQVRKEQSGENLNVQMEMVERLLIEGVLKDHGGRVVAVAKTLGLPRKTLYDKLNRHGLEPARFRGDNDA